MPGHAMLRARPGKPAPVPTSASRQFSTGSSFEAYMDSPKWRRTISTGSVIEVKLTDRFHRSKIDVYSRILATWSSPGKMPKIFSASSICRLLITRGSLADIDSRLPEESGRVNPNDQIYTNMGKDGGQHTPSPYPSQHKDHSYYKCSYNSSPPLI